MEDAGHTFVRIDLQIKQNRIITQLYTATKCEGIIYHYALYSRSLFTDGGKKY